MWFLNNYVSILIRCCSADDHHISNAKDKARELVSTVDRKINVACAALFFFKYAPETDVATITNNEFQTVGELELRASLVAGVAWRTVV